MSIDQEAAGARLRNAIAVDRDSVALNPDHFRYTAPCNAGNIPLESASFDLFFSHAVLEHVQSLLDVCVQCDRVARPSAFTSRVADLPGHIDATGLDMLRYSNRLWELMSSNSYGYTNRCHAAQFEFFFKMAGFRLQLTLTTKQVAEEFASVSVDQLRLLGLSIVRRRAD